LIESCAQPDTARPSSALINKTRVLTAHGC
jgi:hypothetical protein